MGERTIETVITLIGGGTNTNIFAVVKSVSGTENSQAGITGIKPSRVFIVWTHEYDGQREILHDERKFTVYRTYDRADGKTELYTERRTGHYGNRS